MSEFGDKFRVAREKKELSLDDVSKVTKISTRMLKAIEEEKFDILPGGVFNRGFIRVYAKHVGLDSEEAISEYENCLRQLEIDSSNGWGAEQPGAPHTPVAAKPDTPHPAKPAVDTQSARPAKPAVNVQSPVQVEELPELQLPRIEDVRVSKKEYLSRTTWSIPWLRIALVIFVVIGAFFLWTTRSRDGRATDAASTSAPAPQPSPSVAAPAQVSPSAAAPPQQTAPVLPPPGPAAATPAPATPARADSEQSSAANPPAARVPAAAPQAKIGDDPSTAPVAKKENGTARSLGAATKPAEKPAPILTLVVRARENSWISVTSDGRLVTEETLIAPAATSFRATRELVVRVGNAEGVHFLWNGEEVPSQGAKGEAKTYIFDGQGMRTAGPPTQSPPQN